MKNAIFIIMPIVAGIGQFYEHCVVGGPFLNLWCVCGSEF